jgi:hypothetical protein
MCLPLRSILRLRPSFFPEREQSLFSGGAPDPRQIAPGLRGGSLRVFRQFLWLEVGSGKVALPRPAHQRVTPAGGQFRQMVGKKCWIKNHDQAKYT